MARPVSGGVRLILGDCLAVLPTLEAGSVDSCVTDPPYDLAGGSGGGFMGQKWDATKVSFRPETWAAVRRVLRPGAVLLAFGGCRTYHRMVCAIEDAGFAVEDSILAWVQGQGFPKHKSKLKPAYEPIVVARKPGPKWLNVDACRVGFADEEDRRRVEEWPRPNSAGSASVGAVMNRPLAPTVNTSPLGRYPANLCLVHHPDCVRVGTKRVESNGHYPAKTGKGGIGTNGHAGQEGLTERYTKGEEVTAWECHESCPVRVLDEQSGERGRLGPDHLTTTALGRMNDDGWVPKPTPSLGYGDSGGASRFFPTFAWDAGDFAPFLYCPKASKSDRDEGLEGMMESFRPTLSGDSVPSTKRNGTAPRNGSLARNTHPTVKPTALMRWLVRLITPPDGTVLDPFMGSGSTGKAAVMEGFGFVGIEKMAEYHATAERRVASARAAAPLFA